jgi:hypothetical protein
MSVDHLKIETKPNLITKKKMKDFIYLAQGKAESIKNYFHLLDKPNADVIFLTYDQPIKEAIFFPKSTWAQGRNKLLEIALNKGDYLYYIFCDDDVEFIKGSWDIFERQLLTYNPAIAVPINPKTIQTPLKGLKYQCFLTNDEQLIAFHKNVVKDFILLPYIDKFDSAYWWVACQIQETLIQNFYEYGAIQFNNICISNYSNSGGESYVKTQSESDYKIFSNIVNNWLVEQFLGNHKDMPSPKKRPIFILARTFSYYFCRLAATPEYSVSINTLKQVLSNDSELYKQATSLREKFDHLN